jgi:protein-disulfide isomerase
MALNDAAHRVVPSRKSLRSILDLVATVFVILASTAVVAMTVRNWLQPQPQVIPSQDANAPLPPHTAQTLDGAAVLGSQAARVAIIEYSDFQCPYCASFVRATWPAIKHDYVEAGKVVFAFRHLPLPSHRFARSAALSAECARRQHKFWEMHDLLFESQSELNEGTETTFVSRLSLDQLAFETCRASQARESVDSDQRSASALAISATPTFLIGLTQQDRTIRVAQVLQGAQPFARFKAVLDELLSQTNRGFSSWFRWR